MSKSFSKNPYLFKIMVGFKSGINLSQLNSLAKVYDV